MLPKVRSIKQRVLLTMLLKDFWVSDSGFDLLALNMMPLTRLCRIRKAELFWLLYPLSASKLTPAPSRAFSTNSGSMAVSEVLAGVVIMLSTKPYSSVKTCFLAITISLSFAYPTSFIIHSWITTAELMLISLLLIFCCLWASILSIFCYFYDNSTCRRMGTIYDTGIYVGSLINTTNAMFLELFIEFSKQLIHQL